MNNMESMPQNNVAPRVMHTHNTFPMSYEHPLTARFGDCTPFFVFDTEAKDKVPFASFHDLDTLTLSGRFKTPLQMIKDYYYVPYKAICPHTWDLQYVPPTRGDDVPENCHPGIVGLSAKLIKIVQNVNQILTSPILYSHTFAYLLRAYFVLEMFASEGSLLNFLGFKYSKFFPNFEEWSTAFLSWLRSFVSNNEYHFCTPDDDRRFDYLRSRDSLIYFRSLLEWLRSNPDWFLDFNDLGDEYEASSNYGDFTDRNLAFITNDIPFVNVMRPAAYQIAWHHYQTNDKVDYIYSADLYRSTMYGLVEKANSRLYPDEDSSLFFDYNGLSVQYDWNSSKWFDIIFEEFSYFVESLPFEPSSSFIYLSELFNFRKSLKFGDYFTGSRTRPLAVGDITAPVIDSGVSAIDMTKNIMAQRFLNAVNKTGRKLSEYMKGIRGVNIMPSDTDPRYLASDVVQVGSMQVENTAQEQGKIVSLLRSEQSKYAFEADFNEQGVIIGMVSFSIKRSYSRTIERFFFKKDRDDMFNPYFQNIGDQEIFRAEKGHYEDTTSLSPFAYTLRHMEYKQRYSQVSGGISRYFKDWFFVADDNDGEDNKYKNLDPEFIRSHNTEFDRFFASLTGLTLAQYSHFVIRFDNTCNPSRNMEWTPTIL